MIRGRVSPRLEPRISLTFLDVVDNPLLLDVEIDTAFAGFVALPPDVIAHLSLLYIGEYPVELADGSQTVYPCYFARVEWQGSVRTVRAMRWGPVPSWASTSCGAIG